MRNHHSVIGAAAAGQRLLATSTASVAKGIKGVVALQVLRQEAELSAHFNQRQRSAEFISLAPLICQCSRPRKSS
jgi:hypothetical protein